jgi:hypothetical protein
MYKFNRKVIFLQKCFAIKKKVLVLKCHRLITAVITESVDRDH